MKCHYEVLDVSREADDAQIKSAYRKLALKWHPDKNLDNSDYAKEQFQLVQQAYDILMDSQERAWYDKHREQVLHGKGSNFEDDSLDVYQYFTTTCFKGYNDDECGFYTVYGKIFDQLSQEEIVYMEDKEELLEIPTFGKATSDYDDVVGPFYAFWSSFNTRKSYYWLDPYNCTEMRDRKVFKLMEKENKKIRQKARKERNEEVRSLVAFVRKRDKRVQEQTKRLEIKIQENRQKQEEFSKRKRLERKKQLLDESTVQAEWAKFDNVQAELEEIERNLAREFGERLSDSECESEPEDSLYCIACNKVFKTPKSFQNHESSKKHREKVGLVKSLLEDDDERNDERDEDLVVESAEKVVEEIEQKKKQKKAKNVIQADSNDEEEDELLNGEMETVSFEETMKKPKRKSKKKKTKNECCERDPSDTEEIAKSVKNGRVRDSKKKFKVKLGEVEKKPIDTSRCCAVCKGDFQSKNKLFDHLKKTGHGVYLPKNNV